MSSAPRTFSSVQVSHADVILPTYAPAAPDRNPMFLEKRVYQGSSGKVYPLPFIDRIAEKAAPRAWKAVHQENAFNHLLANQSDLRLALGDALAADGRRADAIPHWSAAAEFKGDFQGMSVRAYSEITYYSALALRRLGKKAAADKLLRALLAYARALAKSEAKIDYFATSLPTMLLFDDDLQSRQLTAARFLEAQALLGLGKRAAARARLAAVLAVDPAHALAADLLASS